ncbi:MAG: dihydrodipicolinate reductase C-terminal domain-containing protein [Woeseiaceae bacterium]|nr:dihydrodipicolinate reductase C-terminal domain-containing protein [Woeseiaceae bacterium]
MRLEGTAEVLTLGHAVRDRRVFASGALRAAQWLAGRPPAYYGMDDLLSRESPSAK